MGARGRRADDPVAPSRVVGEDVEVRPGPPARAGVQAVADHRQAAADLLRDDRLEAVPAEDLDRGERRRPARSSSPRSRGSRTTARSGGGSGVGARRARAATLRGQPGAKRPRRERRQRRLAVDPDEPLDERPERPKPQRPVGDRRGRDAHAADEVGLAEEPVAEPRPVARLQLGPGAVVHLGDLHVGRAGGRAHAAAGAPVDRSVGRRDARAAGALGRQQRREPEPLGLRADVLRARGTGR